MERGRTTTLTHTVFEGQQILQKVQLLFEQLITTKQENNEQHRERERENKTRAEEGREIQSGYEFDG